MASLSSLDKKEGKAIWNLLPDYSKTYGAVHAGLETFEILRIENGTPLYPNELNERRQSVGSKYY